MIRAEQNEVGGSHASRQCRLGEEVTATGQPQVVLIGKKKDVPGGFAQCALEGAHISLIDVLPDDADPWIADRFDDGDGVVRAGVVDDDEFVVIVELRQDRLDLRGDERSSVVGGHAHADTLVHGVRRLPGWGRGEDTRTLAPVRSLILRFAGFTGAPIISALAPFIILPVVSRVVGEAGWGNFSAGQSIGVLGMVAILFGWGVLGPVRVARAESDRERTMILRESLRSRLLLTAIVVPVLAVVTWFVCTDSYRIESVAVAVAMSLGGLTPAWFCIGEGNPKGVMLYDALPKLAASLIALPIIAISGQVIWYPILLVVCTLPAFALHAWSTVRTHAHPDHHPQPVRSVLRNLVTTAAIDATGNAYGSTAIPIATVGLSSADASAFASADRVYRIGTLAVVAVGNAFQAWVLQNGAPDARTRQRVALSTHAVLGVVGGAGIALLGPWATSIVFGAQVAAQPGPSALYAMAFVCISLATPMIRNLLIPAGRFRVVLLATISAAVVGITVMLAGASLGSANIIALGVGLSELTALLVLAPPAMAEFRRIPPAPGS